MRFKDFRGRGKFEVTRNHDSSSQYVGGKLSMKEADFEVNIWVYDLSHEYSFTSSISFSASPGFIRYGVEIEANKYLREYVVKTMDSLYMRMLLGLDIT